MLQIAVLCVFGYFACLSEASEEDCYFGSEWNCAMPCHCNDEKGVENPCDPRTGKCLTRNGECGYSMLQYTNPPRQINLQWEGPTCQEGNIGLHKPADQIRTFAQFRAGGAVDGRIGTHTKAAHPDSNDPSEPAWWEVDLQGLHSIHNATIYNTLRGWGNADIMSDFSIKVGMEKDVKTHKECNHFKGTVGVGESVTLDCKTEGRYFSYHRNIGGFAPHLAILAEVVIMGEQIFDYDTDCSKCEESCTSSKQYCGLCKDQYLPPNCRDACPDKHYLNISTCIPCGKCADGEACDYKTGSCPNGCVLWNIPKTMCDTEIGVYRILGNLEVLRKSNDSVTVRFKKADIPEEISRFYYYTINYKRNNNNESDPADSYVTLPHDAERTRITADGLEPNTEYILFVGLERRHNGDSSEVDSKEVKVKTDCTVPKKPIIEAKRTNLDVEIMYELPRKDCGCDYYTSVFLYYKDTRTYSWITRQNLDPGVEYGIASVTLNPGQTLEFKLKVYNNGLQHTESDIVTAGITEAQARSAMKRMAKPRGPPLNIAIIAVGVVAIIGVIAGIFIVVFKGCKRNSSSADEDNGRYEMPGWSESPIRAQPDFQEIRE